MKKLYKAIPVLSLLIAVPTVIGVSSCGGMYSATKEITINNLNESTSVNKLKHGPSLKSLLYGNKHFHKGNYVLFLSSQCSPSINKMLFGNEADVFTKDYKVGDVNTNATLTSSVAKEINDAIYYDWLTSKSSKVGNDTGFVWFNAYDKFWDKKTMDIYNYGANGHEQECGPISNCVYPENQAGAYLTPFGKWTDQDYWHYKNFKHEYKKCKSGKYIINSSSAKTWRSIIHTDLAKLYGISGDNSFVMMQWVQGKYVSDQAVSGYGIDAIPSQVKDNDINSSNSFTSWVINNYKAHSAPPKK